ncbi:MAG: peptide chain release factor N(5)-glutamine methyltransferase [Thermodesulfobacteriota bacterium]
MKAIDLYQHGLQLLKEADVPDPEVDSSLLLGHLLGLSRTGLLLHEDGVAEELIRRFDALLERRLRREPLAYILGEQEFWSLPFYVTPAVLIPRPETELLIEIVLQTIQGEGITLEGASLLDMGTGSGVIPVVLARELPGSTIYSLDISQAAQQVARRNAERHGVADRVFFITSDWISALRPAPLFDLVVSNPPYVARESFADLQPEVRDYEPRLALDGGHAGIEVIAGFAGGLAAIIKSGGRFFMEIGAEQGQLVMDLFSSLAEFDGLTVYEDYAGLPRIFHARRA